LKTLPILKIQDNDEGHFEVRVGYRKMNWNQVRQTFTEGGITLWEFSSLVTPTRNTTAEKTNTSLLRTFGMHLTQADPERNHSIEQLLQIWPSYPSEHGVVPFPPSRHASGGWHSEIETGFSSNDLNRPLPTRGTWLPGGHITPAMAGHGLHDVAPRRKLYEL
jgi:hypothetical protein